MPRNFSDTLDDELLYERVESFGGGMDAFTRSTLLPPDAWQYGENIIVPDNLEARTRPGADRLGASFAATTQGLIYFDTASISQLITGAGAKLYKWEGSAWAELTGANELILTDDALQFEAAQGIDKVLFTDGTQQMKTWDGTNWSAALGATAADPPVGATILCWHTGRMFASGKGSARDTVWVSNRLAFGAGQWNNATRSFRVGAGDGDPIVALASMQQFNLAVLKANSIWICITDPRNDAADFSTLQDTDSLSSGAGCVGKKAWARVGNDLHFMSRDGVRSLQRMEAAAAQYQVTPPLSEPMQPYIDRINWTHANLITARCYMHLVLWSVPLDNSVTNNTVLVWNRRLGRWTGIWTGWAPSAWEMTRFNRVPRLVFGQPTGEVRQWKDFADAAGDATYLDDAVPIPSKQWHRGMLFSEPVNNKVGYHCEARFSASNALVNLTVVADGADLLTFQKDLRQEGLNLPFDLPADLNSAGAIVARRGLRGLKEFNEIYLKVESTAGWWALRNITLTAYLNMLANQ